jgi:hypothetical protein
MLLWSVSAWSDHLNSQDIVLSEDELIELSRRKRSVSATVVAFKLSNDPNFEEKFWDVIGLYLDPPDKALVLCCEKKPGSGP